MAIRRPSSGLVPEFERSRYDGLRMPEEEYLALPEEKPALEYWDGVVEQKAVGKRKHARLHGAMVFHLRLYARSAGGDSLPEGHSAFAGRGWRVPDVSYWAPGKPQGDDDRMLPPTLAVEIRSAGESMAAQRRKCRGMREAGVDVCWLIDPEQRQAERFEGETNAERIAEDGALSSALLPGFAVPLAELWAELDR